MLCQLQSRRLVIWGDYATVSGNSEVAGIVSASPRLPRYTE